MELCISIQDICTRDMLSINISGLVLHRGATIHVDDLVHLPLVLLASMIVTSSSLPRASVVRRPMLHVVSQTAFSPV